MNEPFSRSAGSIFGTVMLMLLPLMASAMLISADAAEKAAAESASGAQRAGAAWKPLGLSGGGAMFAPAISPIDGNTMMINCDMSGAYLTADGGLTWRMIDHAQLRGNTQCRPAFHPKDPQTIFAAGGWNGALMVTHDGGRTWKPSGNIVGELRGEIGIQTGKPECMLAGTTTDVWRSIDGCATWTACKGPHGPCVGFHLPPAVPSASSSGDDQAKHHRPWFAATTEGVWRSDDGGDTWLEKSAGLPWRELRSFTGGTPAKATDTVLYCTIPSKVEGGKLTGGIFRSADGGDSWQSAMGAGLNLDIKAADQWAMGEVAQYHQVVTTDAKPATVYAFNANTGIAPPHQTAAFRSDDAGKSWKPTFFPDPRWPGANVEPDYTTTTVKQFYQDVPCGVAIDARDPDHVMQVDGGRCHITRDGGKTWSCGHTRPAPGQAKGAPLDWLCNGLVVTTTWNHYVDPFDAKLRYICYTDIGFARSLDAGETWRWWGLEGRAPWQNTCYELAFDPEIPGKVWGAFSNIHDIPNGNIIWGNHGDKGEGGVCVSGDHAATWTTASDGLPKAPVTSLVLDPKSPKGKRTLFASVFGHGVYRSEDDGKHWVLRSTGVGSDADLRVVRLQLHADGTLFVLVTAMRKDKKFLADGPGLYRSMDQGGHWDLVKGSNVSLWPKDVTVDPKDSKVIYLGACDTSGAQTAGLYRTKDGGATWTKLARQGSEHFGAYLHPHRAGWIYMTLCEGAPGSGLWLSKDDGATWTAMTGLPFSNVQRVTVDPKDDDVIYVTTFGGSVWKGPASE